MCIPAFLSRYLARDYGIQQRKENGLRERKIKLLPPGEHIPRISVAEKEKKSSLNVELALKI